MHLGKCDADVIQLLTKKYYGNNCAKRGGRAFILFGKPCDYYFFDFHEEVLGSNIPYINTNQINEWLLYLETHNFIKLS